MVFLRELTSVMFLGSKHGMAIVTKIIIEIKNLKQ